MGPPPPVPLPQPEQELEIPLYLLKCLHGYVAKPFYESRRHRNRSDSLGFYKANLSEPSFWWIHSHMRGYSPISGRNRNHDGQVCSAVIQHVI